MKSLLCSLFILFIFRVNALQHRFHRKGFLPGLEPLRFAQNHRSAVQSSAFRLLFRGQAKA